MRTLGVITLVAHIAATQCSTAPVFTVDGNRIATSTSDSGASGGGNTRIAPLRDEDFAGMDFSMDNYVRAKPVGAVPGFPPKRTSAKTSSSTTPGGI
jgi:hypothetical protein